MTPIEDGPNRGSVKPQHQPKPIFPSVSYLARCSKLLLDANDMADFLRIPRKRVQGLIDRGRLPRVMRIGGCVRWSVRELKAWLAAGCPRIEEWCRIQGRRDDPLRDQRYRRLW